MAAGASRCGVGAFPGGAWTTTCSVRLSVSPDTSRVSEPPRPAASVTAVAPASTAATVTTVRAGRANGCASPIVTGRGSRSRPSSRCAR